MKKLGWGRSPQVSWSPPPIGEAVKSEDSTSGSPVLELRNIGKRFGGTTALSDVSVQVFPGEILGIIGENGAGKSTLIKIATGLYPHGSFDGQVLLSGVEQKFSSLRDAHKTGLVLIPQELLIAPELTIQENMFAGDLPGKMGKVDFHRLHRDADTWLKFFEIDKDARHQAATFSPAEQRLAVIAAALSRSAKVLILDEPTASLSDREAQRLFGHLRRLSAMGIPSVFISHRLAEVMELTHRIVVLRNGHLVATVSNAEASIPQLVRAMIGHDIRPIERRAPIGVGVPNILEVKHLSLGDPLDVSRQRVIDVNISVREGEIVGLFGLIGSGRSEIAEALFGNWKGVMSGELTLNGRHYTPNSPAAAVSAGVALLTEDRKSTGIFPDHDIDANLSVASLQLNKGEGKSDKRGERRRNLDLLERFDVRPRRLDTQIGELSGGNQQKVLLGRWFACKPTILILDEPTVGVDVGAREEIYARVLELTQAGVSVLVISSDVTEIQALCDRAIVMRKGKVAVSFGSVPDTHELLVAALGGSDRDDQLV
jgi:ABC-type sugar transport system ATPase subunit